MNEMTEESAKRHEEAIRFFEERYDLIARHPFVAERPIRLSDSQNKNERRCRFCHRGRPEASFKKVAHAVPEFLGNKSILSMNECDSCNEFLAANYEDHLSKWSMFCRSASRVKGKKGEPTFKNPSDTLRIGTGDDGLEIHITEPTLAGQLIAEGGPYSFTLPTDASSQPYVPLCAAMALVKVACSICPASALSQCQRAIHWLMGRANIRVSNFPVLYTFVPGPINNRASEVRLLRRKSGTPDPYLWCAVQFANYGLQFFVPGCPADDALFIGDKPTKLSLRYYRSPQFPPTWPFGQPTRGMLDWSGKEPTQSSATAVFHVSHAERVK